MRDRLSGMPNCGRKKFSQHHLEKANFDGITQCRLGAGPGADGILRSAVRKSRAASMSYAQLAPFLSAFRIANSKAELVEALFPFGGITAATAYRLSAAYPL
jgi:hypothetical protein